MFNPKDVLTENGMRRLEGHLFNIDEALRYLIDHADDLHIGCSNDRQLLALYELQDLLSVYRRGDGEVDEEE